MDVLSLTSEKLAIFAQRDDTADTSREWLYVKHIT